MIVMRRVGMLAAVVAFATACTALLDLKPTTFDGPRDADGSGPEGVDGLVDARDDGATVLQTITAVGRIALAGDYIYWGDINTGTIRRVHK
jgi:hypothetical protein